MNVTVLSTDRRHPVWPALEGWQRDMRARGHDVVLCSDKAEALGGDILFLVSCSQIVGDAERQRYEQVLVLHASELPQGRGWSPHIWSIVGGADRLTVCLIEARDPVDTGDVLLRATVGLDGHELLAEINARLFACELDLMTQAVERGAPIAGTPQAGEAGPYLRKRTPEDSRLDPSRTIADQFDLLRVVDNERYPAFFDHRGHRYLIKIERVTT